MRAIKASGELLRGPLPVPLALDRARQVAEALQDARSI
jgi:hypothetical protein